MQGPNVFASPARRLFFAVGAEHRIAGKRGEVAKWMKRHEGGCFVLADITRPGIDRFLRCRTDWHLENGLEVNLIDPMSNELFKAALKSEFRIEARPTDWGLGDMEFQCGDEVILAIPRRSPDGKALGDGISHRYRLKAVRFGCASCMGSEAAPAEDIASILGTLGGGANPRGRSGGRGAGRGGSRRIPVTGVPDLGTLFGMLNGRPPAGEPVPTVKVTIEFPVQDALRFLAGFLGGMMSGGGPSGEE